MSSKKIFVNKKIFMRIQGVTKESLDKYKPFLKIKSELFLVVLDGNFTKWSLRVYPNGDADVNKSNIGFYLDFEDFDSSNFRANYQLGLVGKTDKGNYMRQFIEKYGYEIEKGDSRGNTIFISHEELFNERSDLIVDGSLTFFCDLTVSTLDGTLEEKKALLHQTVVDDYKRMFFEGLFTDFEFKMSDDVTLKVHKAILAARSPVFLAMLKADMKEVRESCANIPEFDSGLMQEVLRYIYCNEVQGLDEIVHKLIYAADKYQLDGLKDICIDRINAVLTDENVLESLVIADRFGNMKLFAECINYLASCGTFDAISATQEWKDLPKTIMTKIMSKLIKRNVEIHLMPHNI